VWERFLSRVLSGRAYGGNLPWFGWSRPGTFFWHDIEADPRVGIPIGEAARRSKGSLSLPRCLTTESGPSFTFKTRHWRLRNDRQ
jgi:hypothetical protein